MNISGVVILYYPDKDVVQRIQSYRSLLQNLYLFDNSEKSGKELLHSVVADDKVFYFHDGINKGIAKRLNEAAYKAIEDGSDWLLTMDQDSYFAGEALDKYMQAVEHYAKPEDVAMFGIEYDKRLVSKKEGFSYKQVTHLITSGSLVNLRAFKVIGDFDEKLFIDHVDHEYCFRSIQKKYSIIKFDNISLNHSLGIVSKHRSLKNLKSTPRALHSPVRIYYMTRNFLYLNRIYKHSFPEDMIAFRKHLFNRIKNNLLYNKKRMLGLNYILKGFRDFKAGKMGKIE